MPSQEWYSQGLRFSCTQCGNCCTGSPGYVCFHYDELVAMAGHLGIEPDVFLLRYARREGDGWSLREVERDGQYDCVFLKEDAKTGRRGCSIYSVRPTQCRTWPFWPDNLRSRRAWAAAAKRTPCPGMAQGGPAGEGTFYPVEQIRIQRDATPHG